SIAVDDAHLDRLEEILQALQAQGFQVTQTLPTLGVITGAIEENQLTALSQIPGIQVEKEQTYQLPPPGSAIQ
ncbi:MAG: hypothetical protein VKJ24_08545, partial [Synechococcales bacterium]|nr:hypothetical protein [Synechococcales bacterium]